MATWTDLVEVLAGVTHWHSQTDYALLKNSLQKEWDFFQCATLHIGEAFRPVEEGIEKYFLPALFKGSTT